MTDLLMIEASKLAVIASLTTRRINGIMADAGIQRSARAKYPHDQALTALVAHYRTLAEKKPSGDYNAEKLRLTKETADSVALRNAAERRELVPLADIASGLNRAIVGVKSVIMAASNLEREDREKILKACGDMWQQGLTGEMRKE